MRDPNYPEEVKMKKALSLLSLLISMLFLTVIITSCNSQEQVVGNGKCKHRDKNDDLLCDRCGQSYDDGVEPKDRTVTHVNGFVFLIPAHDQANAYLTGYKGNEKNIVIPSTCEGLPVSTIKANAFSNASITSIHIPASVIYIPDDVFNGCDNLKSITVDKASKGFVSIDGNLYSSGGKRLLKYAIGKEDTVFNIPDGVKHISMSAFRGAKYLKEITIPYGVENIYEKTFTGLNIEKINIPGSVQEIGARAFENCTSLVSVTIENGVSVIDGYVFKNCSSLESIVIPNSVREFWDMVFEGCTSLKSAVVGSGISNEPYGMFEGCTALENVIINEGAYSIFPYAFRGCTGLKSVTIPETVKYISDYSFEGCSALTEIVIPDRVTRIESNVFKGCSALSRVVIPKNVTYIGPEAFYECTSLTEITLPDKVTAIHKYAFYGCSSLKEIHLPKQLESISIYTFYGCTSLTTVYIPESVKSIEVCAFGNCTSLDEAVFEVTTGWRISSSISIFEKSISNPKLAAKYLSDDYSDQRWVRYS